MLLDIISVDSFQMIRSALITNLVEKTLSAVQKEMSLNAKVGLNPQKTQLLAFLTVALEETMLVLSRKNLGMI